MISVRTLEAFGRRGAAWLVFVLALATPAAAQEITRATAVSPHAGRWVVWVSMDHGFDRASGVGAGHYVLLDVAGGRRLDLADPEISSDPHPSTLTLPLAPGISLDPGTYYHLFIVGMTFAGKLTPAPLQAAVKFGKPDSHGNVTAGRSLEPADGRDDANFYFSGEMTRTRGKSFQGSVDTKVEYPFVRKWHGRDHYFGPSFDLKASNNPAGDPDSLDLGFFWRFKIGDLPLLQRPLNWRNSPKLEANRDFTNANLLWESRFSILSRVWFNSHSRFYFQPFFGVEVGGNLRSPVVAAAHRFLSRPQVGTSLNLAFPVRKPGLREISLESSYIRRWPLRKEVGFKADSSGKLVPLLIGTSPRDYLNLKLNFAFLKGFGSSLGYEWGELPPSFNLVDHKLSIGLTWKTKVSSGEE